MLTLLSSGLLSVWLAMAGVHTPGLDAFSLVAGPGIPGFVITGDPEPATDATLKQYLQSLVAKGIVKDTQGVWIQSASTLLASNQGTVPLPAASLTKIATSLAALEKWGHAHQFETFVKATGPVKDGVLQGDLVIAGDSDPFFVWEEAFAVGNALNKMGIKRVTGNLIITRNFSMNAEPDPTTSGEHFKQALDPSIWEEDAEFVFSSLPPGTPKPKVEIAGTVKIGTAGGTPILRHRSLPLAEILRQMNVYSNNEMAQMLADGVGGAKVVKERAAKAAGVPPEEIQLINGSGLGQENRVSPRAACAMFMAIQRYLQPSHLTIADLFPVSGQDGGTLDYRHIPSASVVKTGTLWDVSALAGVLPTRTHGILYFAIINRGADVDGFRTQQDKLLQRLQQQWGIPLTPVAAITPKHPINPDFTSAGAANRNEVLLGG